MEISSKTIRFRYRNWRGEVAERVVTPIGLYFAERWYLVGYCHDRQAERHFVLDLINKE